MTNEPKPLLWIIFISYGVKCYRLFPCGHYHLRPARFIVSHLCWCQYPAPLTKAQTQTLLSPEFMEKYGEVVWNSTKPKKS